jgi:hypothetical protein
MDPKLSEEIQAALDALALAQNNAAHVTRTLRKQRLYFGLEYSHFDDDIAQLLNKLRYMTFLAERREVVGAEMPIVDVTGQTAVVLDEQVAQAATELSNEAPEQPL